MKTKVTMVKLITAYTSWGSASSPTYADRERRFYGSNAKEKALKVRTRNGKERLEITEVIVE